MISPLHTIILLALIAMPISLGLIKILVKLIAHDDMEMGRVTSVCTNVIGSLTKRNLAVKSILYDHHLLKINEKREIEIENLENKDKYKVEQIELQKEETLELVAITSELCHYKKMRAIEEETNNFLAHCGFSRTKISHDYDIIQKLETNETKKISTVVARNYHDGMIYAFSKGNPYKILQRCSRIQVRDQKLELTPKLKQRIRRRIDKLNKKGHKVIAFAYKGLPKKQYDNYNEEFTENDLIFTALFSFINPLNVDVQGSIAKAKENDLKIYIVTGTHEKKATALAIQLDIINKNYFENITGMELQDINDQKLQRMLANKEKDYIFSELHSEDKERVYRALEAEGEIIALTNRNDEHSLSKITQQILSGRNYHEGYKKCLHLTASTKLAQILLAIIALITTRSLALSISVVILPELINTLLGLSLKAEKTKSKKENSALKIIIEAMLIAAVLFTLYAWSILKGGFIPGEQIAADGPIIQNANTVFFISLAILQVISAYRFKNSGSSIFSNVHLLLSTLIIGLSIYAFTKVQLLSNMLNFGQLSSNDWQVVAFTLAIYLIIVQSKDLSYNENTATGLLEDQSDSEESEK